MPKHLFGAVFLLALLSVHGPALALDQQDIDRAEGRVLRAMVIAQWNILESMAISSDTASRAIYCGGSDYICLGPDTGNIALELIAAGTSRQALSMLAQLFRYKNPQFIEKVRCHVIGKGAVIRPYLESLRPERMINECASDIERYLRPTGRFPSVEAGKACATASEVMDRVTEVLDAIDHNVSCGSDNPVIPVADEAFLYGMVLSRTPAWGDYCRSSQSSCEGVGLPHWELALGLFEALDTPDALAGLARLYRFSSDAALSTDMGCAVGMKGGKIWPYMREVDASDLRALCEHEIRELRNGHPGKFDAVQTEWVCRPVAEIEKRTRYYRETNPPTTMPDAMYEICN